jgi:cytoskeletal protein RodZ
MQVGTELRRARERAGLSAKQISERTKIQAHRVEALENDNFESLPGGIYLDAIVRAYAYEVGIDPEPLIERIRYQRGEAAKLWQAGPADLDAFAPESQVTMPRVVDASAADLDTSAPDDESDLDVIDRREDPIPYAEVSYAEAVRPERGPGRFVLPLLLLLAVAGLGAYFYLAHGGFDLDRTRGTDTVASSSQPANPVVPVTPQPATRETEVATGTSGPTERAIPATAPKSVPHSRPDAPRSIAPAAAAAPATAPANVSGSWTLATHVESSSYERFEGLKLGYDIQLEQTGNRVTGTGRKVTENGDGIGSRVQTPISVAGTISGDRLTLTFNERGARRPTEGKFVLLLDDSGTMRGRFSSNAAQSSGTVEAHRTRP